MPSTRQSPSAPTPCSEGRINGCVTNAAEVIELHLATHNLAAVIPRDMYAKFGEISDAEAFPLTCRYFEEGYVMCEIRTLVHELRRITDEMSGDVIATLAWPVHTRLHANSPYPDASVEIRLLSLFEGKLDLDLILHPDWTYSINYRTCINVPELNAKVSSLIGWERGDLDLLTGGDVGALNLKGDIDLAVKVIGGIIAVIREAL